MMEQKPFTTRFRVCLEETDATQVVHFSNYFRYFDRTEQEFYRKIGLGGFSYLKRERHGLPRIFASCKYTSPMIMDDEIEVQLKIKHLGEKEIQYEYLIHKLTTNKIAAEGSVHAKWLDIKNGRPYLFPKKFASYSSLLWMERLHSPEVQYSGRQSLAVFSISC